MTEQPYRIIVTGAREYPAGLVPWVEDVIREACGTRPAYHRLTVFKHGDCPVGDGGIDGIVDRYIKRYWQHEKNLALLAGRTPLVDVQPWPADFAGRGPKAGPERNARMVDDGADSCIAFPGPRSRGTWDCVLKAVAAGIPTSVWLLDGLIPSWLWFGPVTARLDFKPVPGVHSGH